MVIPILEPAIMGNAQRIGLLMVMYFDDIQLYIIILKK